MVGDIPFWGSVGPNEIKVGVGDEMVWHSDAAYPFSGFKICAKEQVSNGHVRSLGFILLPFYLFVPIMILWNIGKVILRIKVHAMSVGPPPFLTPQLLLNDSLRLS